jgi:hypothetical protein
MTAMLSGDGTIWLGEASRSDSVRWVRLTRRAKLNGQLVLLRDVLILLLVHRGSGCWDGDVTSVVRYKVCLDQIASIHGRTTK